MARRGTGGNPRWFVMGQVCVGATLAELAYSTASTRTAPRLITASRFRRDEISQGNPRSLRAHRRSVSKPARLHRPGRANAGKYEVWTGAESLVVARPAYGRHAGLNAPRSIRAKTLRGLPE